MSQPYYVIVPSINTLDISNPTIEGALPISFNNDTYATMKYDYKDWLVQTIITRAGIGSFKIGSTFRIG